jgi:hypothetical protein
MLRHPDCSTHSSVFAPYSVRRQYLVTELCWCTCVRVCVYMCVCFGLCDVVVSSEVDACVRVTLLCLYNVSIVLHHLVPPTGACLRC